MRSPLGLPGSAFGEEREEVEAADVMPLVEDTVATAGDGFFLPPRIFLLVFDFLSFSSADICALLLLFLVACSAALSGGPDGSCHVAEPKNNKMKRTKQKGQDEGQQATKKRKKIFVSWWLSERRASAVAVLPVLRVHFGPIRLCDQRAEGGRFIVMERGGSTMFGVDLRTSGKVRKGRGKKEGRRRRMWEGTEEKGKAGKKRDR